jgi:hypothetical protein
MALNVNGFFPGELKPDAVVGGCIEVFENASNYAWHKYHFEDRKPNKLKKDA